MAKIGVVTLLHSLKRRIIIIKYLELNSNVNNGRSSSIKRYIEDIYLKLLLPEVVTYLNNLKLMHAA